MLLLTRLRHRVGLSHESCFMYKRRAIAKAPADRRMTSWKLRGKLVAWSILLFVGAALCVLSPNLFAQDRESRVRPEANYTVIPLTGVSHATVRASVMNGATIPLWDYSVTSPLDGKVYPGTMVGRSPFFRGARTTDIPTIIVPLKIKFSNGTVFDPTATDHSCSPDGTPLNLTQNSPIFAPIDISMGGVDIGVSQYLDAFQRGNFWTEVSMTGDSYHTTLSPVTALSAVTVTVPAADGAVFSTVSFGGCGGIIGVMNIGWFDSVVQATIIPSLAALGVGPTTFPLFLLKDVVMTSGPPSFPSNCCILGYHAASGSPVQTYSPFDYDTTKIFSGVANITAMSHEVGEWMDDPIGNNPTPLWGHIGQVGGCQGNLEEGDPLSGTEFPALVAPNGVTYNPQELAFFSWFFRLSPSLGVNGWYSDNGTFSNGAGAVCM
jgi:hypothetical protein